MASAAAASADPITAEFMAAMQNSMSEVGNYACVHSRAVTIPLAVWANTGSVLPPCIFQGG